jgi:hypothetical protein
MRAALQSLRATLDFLLAIVQSSVAGSASLIVFNNYRCADKLIVIVNVKRRSLIVTFVG